jgi:hypothetical protein
MQPFQNREPLSSASARSGIPSKVRKFAPGAMLLEGWYAEKFSTGNLECAGLADVRARWHHVLGVGHGE